MLGIAAIPAVTQSQTTYSIKDLNGYDFVKAVAGRDNTPWIFGVGISAKGYAVQRFENGAWKVYSTPEFEYPFPDAGINDIAADSSGNILVAINDNILVFNPQVRKWSKITYHDTLDQRDFMRLTTDSHGRVWITADAYFIISIDTTKMPVTKVVEAYSEVFLLENNQLKKMYIRRGWAEFSAPMEDKAGAIWLAYVRYRDEGGLMKFDGADITTVNLPDDGYGASRAALIGAFIDKTTDDIYLYSKAWSANEIRYPTSFDRFNIATQRYETLKRFKEKGIDGVFDGCLLADGRAFVGMECAGCPTGSLTGYLIPEQRFVEGRVYAGNFFEHPKASGSGFAQVSAIGGTIYWGCRTRGLLVLDIAALPTGVVDALWSASASLPYPNPIQNGSINVHFATPDAVISVDLCNISGQYFFPIFQTFTDRICISTDGLSAGTYRVRIRTAQGKFLLSSFVIE